MPEVIFTGAGGRLEGRYHPARQRNAPIGIVLHPPRRGIDLRERHLRRGAGTALAVEQNGAGARRPLIDGQDESLFAHRGSGLCVWLTIQPQYSALPPSVGSTSSAGSS